MPSLDIRDVSMKDNNNVSIDYWSAVVWEEPITTAFHQSANSIETNTRMTIIFLAIGVFGFFSNIFVVVVIALYRPMHKQLTNVYIVNQSVIDSTVALFLFLSTILEDDHRPRSPGKVIDEAVCRLWFTKMPLWSALVSSTYGIVALTFERYLAVVHPIYHKATFSSTKFISGSIIAFTLIIGPAFNISYMTPTAGILATGQCTVLSLWPSPSVQAFVGLLTIVVQYFLPLTLLAYGYTRMIWTLHKRVDVEVPPGGDARLDRGPKRNESMARARSNVLRTLVLVACSFIACWSWNQIYYLMYFLGFPYSDFTSVFYNFTVIMVFVNCCVNPIIYCLKYESFQRGLTFIFCRCSKVQPVADRGLSTIAVE